MKILWLCNMALPVAARQLGMEASNKEGWLSGLADMVWKNQEESGIVLSAAFPLPSGFLEGGDVQAAAEEVKLRSRQYAKRQLTWFRRTAGANWIYLEKNPDFEAVCQTSTAYMEKYGIS